MKFLSLLALLPLALGEQFVIPQVAAAIDAQLSEFQHYTAYRGPTGAASSKIAATPSLRKLVAEQPQATAAAAPYWYETIAHQGKSPYNTNASYVVYRNVKTYGAQGDGVTDDTAAINRAISDGARCGPGTCNSSTIAPAVVYFPAGTYVISSSLIDYYNTILLGNPNSLPVLRATPVFSGFGLIDGDQYQAGGVLGFGGTNIFYRQIRNFVIDMTHIPATSAATGIHWPTAQATSLQNIVFQMSSAPGTQHQGVFIESGSGGFMNDLVFYGGLNGAVFGNQQFTVRNLTFYNAVTALSQLWDWGWTYQSINVVNCTYGLNFSGIGTSGLVVGSVTFLDSTFTNTSAAFVTGRNANSAPATANSLSLENIKLNNVPVAVLYGPYGSATSTVLAGTTGSTTIGAWGSGNLYNPTGATHFQGSYTAPTRPTALLGANGAYYQRSKPQYETLAASSFSSVKAGGAKGDGVTDDTAAIQKVITAAQAAKQVVYFDAGTYRLTSTLLIPSGSRVVGEAYATLLAWSSSNYWGNINAPEPVVKIGNAGGKGAIEWSDMVVSTRGPAAGAILIQWNLAAAAGTPGGMWDVHARIGGAVGTQLRVAQCPTAPGNAAVNTNCLGAYLAMHITPSAAGVYLENVWLWTADHDIDSPTLTQVTVYAGRGLLVESTTGPTWLVGTAVEHHSQYQYQLAHTTNVYAGQIQTETPYYQPAPAATQPFPANATLDDPSWSFYCPHGGVGPCAEAWGLRVDSSSAVHVYGAGLYSFFSNYSTACSDAGAGSDCQSAIFVYDAKNTTNLYVYNLNTIGAFGMVYRDTTKLATYSNNLNVFPSTIWFFRSN